MLAQCFDKGPANGSVSAGLTNSSGTLSSAIPVTIVATNSSEQPGDPVDVDFAYLFDVKTFVSNTATANFFYAVTYTYDGVTTTIAASAYEEGAAA